MDFDQILHRYVGEKGRFQIIHAACVALPMILTSFSSLSSTFTGLTVPHRCLQQGEPSIQGVINNLSSTITRLGYDAQKLQCSTLTGLSDTSAAMSRDVTIVPSCNYGYKWDTRMTANTFVQRWELVCDKTWLRALFQSLYYVGQAIGSIFFGYIGDKFGRKTVLIIGIACYGVLSLASAFVPFWPLFMVLRLLLGVCHTGISISGAVLTLEMIGPAYRLLSGANMSFFFISGQVILGVLAYLIRDYQILLIVLSAPSIFVIAYYIFAIESPRWLLAQGKIPLADKNLRKIADFNGKTLPDDWYSFYNQEKKIDEKRTTLMDIFRNPIMCKRIIAHFILWISVTMAYYGLTLHSNFLGGDPYLTFIFAALTELSAPILFVIFVNFLGRKFFLIISYALAALGLILASTLHFSSEIGTVSLVIFSKTMLGLVYATLYTYSPEVFPTAIRTTAVGACSMMGRIGGIFASYLSLWLVETHPMLVVSIFVIACIVSSIIVLFLPETARLPQVQTMKDAEMLGKDQHLWTFGWNMKID